MQSNQSKLLIAGLVATQVTGNQIERPEDLMPQEYTEGVKSLLAQIKDDDSTFQGVDIITIPSNSNNNTEQDAIDSALNTPTILETDELSDKVDLVVEAALGGLDAKKEFWKEKLQMYADERLLLFRQVDESCRIKTDAAAQRGIEIMQEAAEKAFIEHKQCRKDFIDALLLRKEELKGDLQNTLNETIIRIKELKVGEVLNESGLPTQEHATILKQEIENEIEAFNTAMEDYVTDNYMPTVTDELTNVGNCRTAALAAFNLTWRDATPVPPQGVMEDISATYTECFDEMMNLRLKITEVIGDMRNGYVEEANIQQHLAKTDFLKLVAATIKKIHDLTGLTEEEKEAVMDDLYTRRQEFGAAVMNYITEVTNETLEIVDNLTTEMMAIEMEFTEEVSTNQTPAMPIASTNNQVEDMYDDLLIDVTDKAAAEVTIATQMQEEVMGWLENHITHLQEALQEICENEHSYHYTPPGFHVDETAVDLAVFQQLSEKFELVVVQMVGTFDTFVDAINTKISTIKERKKEEINLRRIAAQRSLTMATGAFGDGIEYVRESVEMKAGIDQNDLQKASTDAREIIEFQLEQKRNNLWRSISYLAKKLYADERADYNNKIKSQILAKFKEFKQVILDATTELHESQSEKWLEYQTAMADYYKFYDKKIIGAKQSLFDVAQQLLMKKLKTLLIEEDENTGGKLDEYEMKVFKQLHQNRDIMTALYNNAIQSIDKIEDRYLTTPLIEILNGHKEEADYEFDYREDMFLDDFVLVREWFTTFLEDELDAFEEHIVSEAVVCDDKIQKEKQLLVQKTSQMKEEMQKFYDDENKLFKDYVDECVNRFKWLLKKYGMDARLPEEDELQRISPDPFTGALNQEDTAAHKDLHDKGIVHGHGDVVPLDEQNDPLASLPGKPSIPKNQGLKPHDIGNEESSDDSGHNVPGHEHTTPHLEDLENPELAQSDVDSHIDERQVEAEVNAALATSNGIAEGFGIDDEELKKKIVATVEFFLGKLPARSGELISALTTRRTELSAIIDHVRNGLTQALDQEFVQAWATLAEFTEKLNYALKERDTAALGAVGNAVNEFIADVNDLREQVVYAIKDLRQQLAHVDYDTQAQIAELIIYEKDRFEAGIDEALTNMEIVVADMQTAQDTAFGNARQALATALNGKRTAFQNSLTRDAATFQDALDHNYNAFIESVGAQRAAFESSLAEKQAAFDAAKARKLKQIHFVHDSNYKFHLIKLLEAKAAAITEALGQARQGFTDALNQEVGAFETFREIQRSEFDAVRQELRDRFAQGEVDAETALNDIIEHDNEAFDEALVEASRQLAGALNEQRDVFSTYLAEEEHYEEEYTYTEHVAPTANYSPYSHSAHTQFLSQFHYYLSDQLKKLDAGIDGIAEWTQKEVDAAIEAFGTAVGYSEQRLGDQRVMGQEALAQLADSLATEYAEAQDLELEAIKEKRAGLEEAIAAKAEELKKKIVYLKKQLHYKGGGTEREEFKLEDAIIALVGEFDAAVAEIRAWFANNVETELGESTARANAVGEAFAEATGRLMEIQAALSAELAQAARDGAVATEKEFVVTSQERLDAFNYVIAALAEKVENWYEEKLAWIGGLNDQYYGEDLRSKLTAKRDQALAALADRSAAAHEVVAYRREELAQRLGELITKFDDSANYELQTLADTSAAEAASLAGDVQATNDGFAGAANFELNGLNAFLDDLVRQWVWWLKQYYGYAGYEAVYYEGYDEVVEEVIVVEEVVPGHEASHAPATIVPHNPVQDHHLPHGFDPYSLPGYDEIEIFLTRDFIEDLPAVSDHLLVALDGAATELEHYFATYEDNAEATLEGRRLDLQARLVADRETIEAGLTAASIEAKDYIIHARESFAADVAHKRAAVEGAIVELKNAHYPNEADQKALLYEIHEAKEAFAAAVQDARADFDALLVTSREASEKRLYAAREQFDTDLTRKRADLDNAINTLRVQLADVAASKREALGLVMGAAWEDLEVAIAEKVDAFHYAVAHKLEWINQVHYYDLRHSLVESVKQLQAVFIDNITGLRAVFADAAEDRRLAADAAISKDQDDFEYFVASILDTCDANRAAESGYLEKHIVETREHFDIQLGECRKAISWAIDEQIQALKTFLQSQYGYQGHKPGPYTQKPEGNYFEDEHVDAVQEYIDHVTAPQQTQAAATLEWIASRKEAQKEGNHALEQEIIGVQNGRATYEAEEFKSQADSLILGNGDLAAGLLADIQAKNDAIQGTLEALKHEHYGYQDASGYRYKLLNQLHHQRVIFEQAVEAAWVTWTQSRDLAVQTAASGAAAAAESFEGFLATKLGEWEASAAATIADLSNQIQAKGEALKASIQEAARVFTEKQAYKRNFISTVEDHYKREALSKKVDLEDAIFQETVKGIWQQFTYEATGLEAWLDTFFKEKAGHLGNAQDAIGNALADALADQLDRLGAALGELGDAFFQAKHDESERLMQALYGYGYGDYKPDYQPVFKHEDERVEHPHEHRPREVYSEPQPVYPEPEPVYHEPVYNEVYSATTQPGFESSEGYLSEDTYDSGPYSESQLRNTEYDSVHHPVHHPVVHHPAPAHPQPHYEPEHEVFYEGEDPYVTRHAPAGVVINAPDYHNEPVYEPSYYEPTYDEATHYAAAEPVYHQPEPVYHSEPSVYYEDEDPYVEHHHEPAHVHHQPAHVHHEPAYHSEPSIYSDTHSVYESTDYGSSLSTSHYGETSYRSEPRYVQPVRNYEHVEPYRPEPVHVDSYAAPVVHHVHHDDHYSSHSSHDGDNDITINIFNGVGGGTNLGFAGHIDCAPRVGECRPQCPEVQYNEYDQTLHFTWDEDVANCNDYPENTWLTLYSPTSIGQAVVDDLTQNLVREIEGTAVPYGGISFPLADVFNNGHGFECDQSYFVSGMYTWWGKTGHRVYGMPNTSPNSVWIPCSKATY